MIWEKMILPVYISGSSFKRYRRIADSGFSIQVGDRHKQSFCIFITIGYSILTGKQPDTSFPNSLLAPFHRLVLAADTYPHRALRPRLTDEWTFPYLLI